MSIKLNERAYSFALAQIEAGNINRDDQLVIDEDAQLVINADPGLYHLAEIPAADGAGGPRYLYPMGLPDGDDLVVFQTALQETRDLGDANPAIFAAAGELLGAIERHAAGAGDGSGDEDAAAAAGGSLADPKPPEQDPEFVEEGDGHNPHKGAEVTNLLTALPAGLTREQLKPYARALREHARARGGVLDGTALRELFGSNTFYRGLLMQDSKVDMQARTVELAFSSEVPFLRWWGYEVLGHDSNEVRMERLNDGGAVLVDHDTRDHVGVVESARLDMDRIGRAHTRFGVSDRAQEVLVDIDDEIRRHVSVGYIVHRMVLVDGEELTLDDLWEGVDPEDMPTFRVVDWEPVEVSIVAVPADASVGIGRALNRSQEETQMRNLIDRLQPMLEAPDPAGGGSPAAPAAPAAPAGPTADELQATAEKQAQERVGTISALGAEFDRRELADTAIKEGWDVPRFRKECMDTMKPTPPASAPGGPTGLTPTEANRFSVLKVLRALADPTDHRLREAAAFEFDACTAAQKIGGRELDKPGVIIPAEVLSTRDWDTSAGTGGELVPTLKLGFIDMLRNAMLTQRLGAQVLTGLNGNVDIPQQTGGATAYWVAEAGGITESSPTTDQVELRPKTVGAYSDLTRKLLLQSSLDAEMLVRRDIANTLAVELDRAAIEGSGSSNQPTGILNTTGIGDVAGGTNGLAPTWAHIVAIWEEVSKDNALMGNLAWMINSQTAAKLMETEKVSGQGVPHILPDITDAEGFFRLMGYRAGVSENCPGDLDKGTSTGVCSAIMFGNWAELIIALWGTGLALTVDPYTNATSGTVRVVGLLDADIGVRHAASFAAMQDCLSA